MPPAVKPAAGALPERLSLQDYPADDAALNGSCGSNRARAENLQISASNDLQAIDAFLAEYRHSPATLRAYTKECERLLLWCLHSQHKPLSSLTREDFVAYMAFLEDPQPRELWCGPKKPRDSKQWRPFVGPLSSAGKAASLAAINSLMTWLQDAGYLSGNPLGLIRQRRREFLNQDERATRGEPQKVERYLDPEMWQAFVDVINALPASSERELEHKARARFIMAILYFMAPRISDLERHGMSSFIEQNGRWWWKIVGKGDKPARLPVPDAMMKELVAYRRALGLPPIPTPDDDTPLLASLDGSRPISGRRLNQILKQLFHEAALRLDEHAPHKAVKLRKASAHWGRHTALTRLADETNDRTLVQKVARHSDLRTTELYIHDEDNALHDKVRKRTL